MEVNMEKYIKNLSITFIIMTALFFMNMFGAVGLDGTSVPQVIIDVLVLGANALLYLNPILFMVIFGICMISLFKRVFANRSSGVKGKFENFPMLWFVLSTLCFFGFFMFVNLIFGAQ